MHKNIKKILLGLNIAIVYYLVKIHKLSKDGSEDRPIKSNTLLKKLAKKINKILGLNIVVKGVENISKTTHFIAYSNHRGLYDPLIVLTQMNEPISFVMKKELGEIKIIKKVADITDSRFFGRTPKEDIKTIVDMCDKSKNGVNYLIFPEGTRNDKDELLEFKGGSFKIPLKSHCDILPICLHGTENVLDKNSNDKNITISILEPLTYDDYKDMNAIELSGYVQGLVQKEYDIIKG